jgi:hypothetical protein
MKTTNNERAMVKEVLLAKIDQATGEHREALLLFLGETEASEFWKGEAEALMTAIVAAIRAESDGPGKQILVEAVREAKVRTLAWIKNLRDDADEPA